MLEVYILTVVCLSFDEQSSGDSGANVKRLEKETAAKIDNLKAEASRISQDVVQMLLKHVTTVKN